MTIDAVVERVSEGGNLLANLALIDIKTWQTSQEVFRDWNNGASVEGVNTANLAVYRLVNNEVVFNLLGRKGNPFCDEQFQEQAYNGILNNYFFVPQGAMKEHIAAAIQPDATVRYSGLHVRTKDCGLKYGYVEAGEKNNDEEKKLFALIYGTSNPCNEKRVYLLREKVVRAELRGKEDNLIARACFLDNFQVFYANDWGILIYLSAVRGVRRGHVAEGDAKKVPCAPQETDSVRAAYTTVLDNINSLSAPDVLGLYEALQPIVMAAAREKMQS